MPVLNLGWGEPSKANGFDLHSAIEESVIEVIKEGTRNGYTHYKGAIEARQAIVNKFSHPDYPFTEKDIWITSGTHGALFLAVNALCNRGDSILVPRPGFSLIRTITDSIGVNLKFYDLLPDQEWKIDLESVRR